MGVHAGPHRPFHTGIIKDGLVFWVDALDEQSSTYEGVQNNGLTSLINNSQYTDIPSGSLHNGVAFEKTSPVSYVFDGTNDYIHFGNNGPSFGDGSSDTPFTWEAWVYIHDNEKFRVFSKYNEYWFGTTAASSGADLLVYLISGGSHTSSTRMYAWSANHSISVNQWICLSATYNGGGEPSDIKTYVNANFESNTTAVDGGSYTAMTNDNWALNVGRSIDNASYSDGQIASIRMYNRELSATEISSNFETERTRFGV